MLLLDIKSFIKPMVLVGILLNFLVKSNAVLYPFSSSIHLYIMPIFSASSAVILSPVNIKPAALCIPISLGKKNVPALSGTSPTCDVDNGGAFSLTMSGNTTFTFSGASSGYVQGFILQLTGNGSTVTYPNTVRWAGGSAPDAPANGETDILCFVSRDGGSNYYGALAVDAAS